MSFRRTQTFGLAALLMLGASFGVSTPAAAAATNPFAKPSPLPFQAPDHVDKQLGFAQFGGPHILTLVTEVATRALKAVRYQKFNIHRRLRPPAAGGPGPVRAPGPGAQPGAVAWPATW